MQNVYLPTAFETIRKAQDNPSYWSMAEAQARTAVLKDDSQTARILLKIAQRRGA